MLLYGDADWPGDLDDSKLTSGYRFKLNGAIISWKSKKQTCVVLSTAKVEYMALERVAQLVVWMQCLLYNFNEAHVDSALI